MAPIVRKGRLESSNSQLITIMIKALGKNSPINRNGRLYASTAGHCSRASALYNAVDPKVTVWNGPASEFYFAIGNVWDDVIGKAYRKAGILLAQELNLPDIGINMGGRVDLIVDLGGAPVIVELKSCGNTMPRYPKPEHEAQAMIYSAVLGLPAYVLYVSRNPANYKGEINAVTFELETTDDALRYHLTQAVLGFLYTRNKVIPPIPERITSESHCGFCAFKQACWHGAEMPWPMISPERHEKALAMAAKRVDEIMAKRPERRAVLLKELKVKDMVNEGHTP